MEIQASINAFQTLKTLPQVILLTCHHQHFQTAIQFLIKKIICNQNNCLTGKKCLNCQNFNQNFYLDLIWKKLNWQNSLKKHEIENFLTKLRLTSLENKPKILVIEQVEYATKAAANAMLKLLENLPNQVFIIFATNNLNSVLPTITSRSQIFNFSETQIKLLDQTEFYSVNKLQWWEKTFWFGEHLSSVEFESVLQLVQQFIVNDNQNRIVDNFLLIKEIAKLKEKVGIFFQILNLIVSNKITGSYLPNNDEPEMIKKLQDEWNKNYQTEWTNHLSIITKTLTKIDNKTNFFLLLNYFMIKFYQGIDYESEQ